MMTVSMTATSGEIKFWCPGCDCCHVLPVKRDPNDARGWTWNGSHETPTLGPSVKVTSGHYVPNWKQGDGCWCEDDDKEWSFDCVLCHSYVEHGFIRYLTDSTHHLSGQTVPLPPIEEWRYT